jgi:ethanolamine ammonia-lyase small subunit
MAYNDYVIKNQWDALKQYTAARIALGRAGSGIPTSEYLRFRLAHAQAKDAVCQPFDKNRIIGQLQQAGLKTLSVESQAGSKPEYLARPDLGRKLSASSVQSLMKNSIQADILIVVSDGLSSKAVHEHAVPLVEHFLPYADRLEKTLYPVVVAEYARVALGDEIGQLLNAPIVIHIIGERPGLSSPDSLGIYLTWNPVKGRLDSERNCISNIRPEGLPYDNAAFKLAWLVEQAFGIHCTGIQLKDRSDEPALYL